MQCLQLMAVFCGLLVVGKSAASVESTGVHATRCLL